MNIVAAIVFIISIAFTRAIVMVVDVKATIITIAKDVNIAVFILVVDLVIILV